MEGIHRESPWCAPGTLLIQCRLHKTKKHTVPSPKSRRRATWLCHDCFLHTFCDHDMFLTLEDNFGGLEHTIAASCWFRSQFPPFSFDPNPLEFLSKFSKPPFHQLTDRDTAPEKFICFQRYYKVETLKTNLRVRARHRPRN